jgi:hypothetical protein
MACTIVFVLPKGTGVNPQLWALTIQRSTGHAFFDTSNSTQLNAIKVRLQQLGVEAAETPK